MPPDPLRKWRGRETPGGTRLPYARLIGDNLLLLRDGSLLGGLYVPGLPGETTDPALLAAWTAQRELWLRGSLDARFVLGHHVVRRRIAPAFDGAFPDPFSAMVDAQWQAELAATLHVNEQFVTLVRRPARGKSGWPERLNRWLTRMVDRGNAGADGDPQPDLGDIRALEAALAGLAATLQPFGARPLGSYRGPTGAHNELLELLGALYNGSLQPIRTPPSGTDVGRMLPAVRLSFGLDAIERRGAEGVSFAALLSLKDYPDATSAGLIDPVLALPCELVLSASWAPSDRQIARERIDLALRRQRAADEDALAERDAMLAARDQLGLGAVGFGDHHLTIAVRAPTLPRLDSACAMVATALADAGAIAVREELALEPAFWGQFPGNEAYIGRRALIATTNMADFAALSGHPAGEADAGPWGAALTVLPTTAATPRHVHLHHGDLGHFALIGPSGAGKTVLLHFLAAQALRHRPRLVMFDKDRGAEPFVRALGGDYQRLAPGHPTGFNPLALPDTPVTRAFLTEWFEVLLTPTDAVERELIAAAIAAAFANAPELRRLSHFRELLAGHRRPVAGDLASRLDPWLADGPHGWLFDQPGPGARDLLDLGPRVTGFDMTALFEAPRLRTPVMLYLFHRIEAQLDGHPAMILIDEGWKMLDDAVFANRIRDWLKTLRKRNAVLGLATQSARDALDSAIAPALVEQTATTFFLPNPRARSEDYGAGFGLGEHEVALIRGLPAASRAVLMRQGGDSALLRLDLGAMPGLLTVLSGREATVRRLDILRAQLGDDPAVWYPVLTGEAWGAGGSARRPMAEAAE